VEAVSGESKHKPVSLSREYRESLQATDESESEALVRQSSLVKTWEAEEPPL
jgi:hypothetical protein